MRTLSLLEMVLGFSLALTCACGSAQNKGFAALLLTTRPAALPAATTGSGHGVSLQNRGPVAGQPSPTENNP